MPHPDIGNAQHSVETLIWACPTVSSLGLACAQSDEDDGKDDTSMLDEKSELSYGEFLGLVCARAMILILMILC